MTYTPADMLRFMQHEFDLTLPAEEHRQQMHWILSALVRLFKG